MSDSEKNPKLVFIAGLGHSGSTMTDLLLGAQEKFTGLGEIHVLLNKKTREKFLKKYDKYPCTCGKAPSKCKIWGSVKKQIKDNHSYSEVYRSLLDQVEKKMESRVIVDSSKNYNALEKIYHSLPALGIEKSNFYVLHLTKDIRGYAVSSLKNKASDRSTLYYFYDWYRVNRKIDIFLQKESIKFMRVGYEELALSTLTIGKKILTFLEEESDNFNVNMNESKSHIIFGNNMRLKDSNHIKYDYRWFTERGVQQTYSWLPFISKMNKKWVYHNS